MIKVKEEGARSFVDLSDMEGVEGVEKAVLLGRKEGVPSFVMRLFKVAPGGNTPYHEHDWEHEVYVLAGEGVVKTPEGERGISSGDAIYVSPGQKHQFQAKKELQFICLVPKRGEPGKEN